MIKRRLFWWLFMFVLLVSVVWLASNNEGYVLVVRSPYRFQFSFNFLLILMVLGFLLLHYCLRFILFLRRLPANKRSKKEAKRLKESNEALLEGLHALADGDYQKAETATTRAHDLIHDANIDSTSMDSANLEKVIETIAFEKQKQEVLPK